MNDRTATIIGATGLIGSRLLDILLKDQNFHSIHVLARRDLNFQNPKIRSTVLDFSSTTSLSASITGSSAVFCAVGTTQKKVRGDAVEYRKVDYDISVRAAQACGETGCCSFLLVSSVGADSRSGSFYLRLKGEVEDVVRRISIPSISIFRPSMLLGAREKYRPGEAIGGLLMRPLTPLIPSRYRPILASRVAAAMVAAAHKKSPGVEIYHYLEMEQLAAALDASSNQEYYNEG